MYSSRSAGLEVEEVSGVAKGAGYEPGMFTRNHDNNDDCAHAWNKVKIDGTWFFMDATWSAGACSESQNFSFRYFGLDITKNRPLAPTVIFV